MQKGRALSAVAELRAGRLSGVGAIGIGQALDAEPAGSIAIGPHRIARRAVGAAGDATLVRGVADFGGVTMRVGQTFRALVALEIAIGLSFAASRIADALHTRAARSAEVLGSSAIGIGQTFDAGRGDGVAIRRGGRALAIAGAWPGLIFRILGSFASRKVDGARVAHRATKLARGRREETEPRCEPEGSPRECEGTGESGGEHAIHPYRYK